MVVANFKHRIVRTGRIDNAGIAISFASPGDTKMLQEIEDCLGHHIPEKPLPSFKYQPQTKLFTGGKSAPRIVPKHNSNTELNAEIMKIRINAGKKKTCAPAIFSGRLQTLMV